MRVGGIGVVICLSALAGLPAQQAASEQAQQSSRYSMAEAGGKWQLLCDGQPFYIKGAVGNELDWIPPGRPHHPELWDRLNDIATEIKKTDPLHPVLTVVGTGNFEKNIYLEPNKAYRARVVCYDSDYDALTFQWDIRPEVEQPVTNVDEPNQELVTAVEIVKPDVGLRKSGRIELSGSSIEIGLSAFVDDIAVHLTRQSD